MIGTLADDTLGIGNPSFAHEEERKSKRFDVRNARTIPVSVSTAVTSPPMVSLHQTEYAASLKKLSRSNFTNKEISHSRGQLPYIATSSRPDTDFASAQLAEVKRSDASASHVRTLNSAVSHLNRHPRGTCLPKLDMDTLKGAGIRRCLLRQQCGQHFTTLCGYRPG